MEPTPSRSGIPSVPKELDDNPVAPTNSRGISRPIHGKPPVSDDKQRSRRYRGESCFSGRSTVLAESPAQMHIFSHSQAANQAVQNPKRLASTSSMKFTTTSPTILMMMTLNPRTGTERKNRVSEIPQLALSGWLPAKSAVQARFKGK
ncbi:hypothetical protein Asppvi_011159 [Aspergillus pseudoviridinutans]|uniref:Uncharacterized protein n=1 Tax=Aspergillus pseudoviridinutans TaxID=1517512 RepID=A0A9P3F0N6_9EURO|nr:uncharacterized protein Asppvi_011159 [Aspergillus pseudoviridinutans]GIJ92183.1 hypothetical protein Asppvi_011159 [Aspergillus pseudoviridinutans]